MALLNNNNKGFTLIGTLFAAIIVVSTMLLAIQLTIRADEVVTLSRHRFGAASLAREGLELTRAIRDTRWFESGDRANWLNGICNEGEEKTYETVQFSVNAQTIRDSNLISDVSDSAVPLEGYGVNYDRVMSIDCSTQDEEPAYVLVSADVSWEYKGQPRIITVREKLFNWFHGGAQPRT
ncbi:MAG: hypothetical protein WEC84_01865 [Candidatus Andersenbacteria bacterium]